MWEQDLDKFIEALDEMEKKDIEETVKRVEKNVEKLLRGGSKMIKEIVYSNQKGISME